MPEEPVEYEFLMSFVLVKSNGGPHDDLAFASGWRLGALDQHLGWVGGKPNESEIVLMAEEVEQADLIAMRHGYTTTTEELGDGWVQVRFSRGEEEGP